MPDKTRAQLQRRLLDSYHSLRGRLARRLGSPDLAAEALHETWLRLERTERFGEVSNLDGYLYRAAMNTASNIRLSESRKLNAAEIDALLNLPDDGPDPDRIVDSRQELARLTEALSELSARQQAVFREALLGSMSYEELARMHGVTVRTIHNDIRRTIEHCAKRLGKEIVFTIGRHGLSRK